MKYRPIGIAPLRNYGWELSEHLRAPSRQVGAAWKKGTSNTSYGEQARFYMADETNQRKPILSGARRVAGGILALSVE